MPDEANGGEKRKWVLAALNEHERRLTRYAIRLAGDDEAARDAVQHVFLRLCDQSPAELNGCLLPWLYTVCRNKIIDQHRRNGRHESLDTTHAQAIVGREPDPAFTAEQQDLGEWLRELVEALPTSLREVVGLWLDGFSHPEIAKITDRTPGHVRVLIHRALTKLRTHPHTRDLLAEMIPTKTQSQPSN